MPRKSSGVGGLGVFGGLICSASERRLAERGGFEPPVRFHVRRISSAVHSTTLPPLRRPKVPNGAERAASLIKGCDGRKP